RGNHASFRPGELDLPVGLGDHDGPISSGSDLAACIRRGTGSISRAPIVNWCDDAGHGPELLPVHIRPSHTRAERAAVRRPRGDGFGNRRRAWNALTL